MNILIYTSVESLLSRWLDALAVKHSVVAVKDAGELDSLPADKRFDLLLLHDKGQLLADDLEGLRHRFPACKIVVLADRPDDKRGAAFLGLGVVGYGNSYMTAERLIAAVEAVASGTVWISQNIMQQLIGFLAEGKDLATLEENPGDDLAILSRRELQIAQLVAEGRSNLEIAQQLDIAERTVKAHMSSIFIKVGVRGRLQLALLVNKSIA